MAGLFLELHFQAQQLQSNTEGLAVHSESGALLFGSTLALAFWTVLVAELVGDKSMYTLSSLALRFRAIVILTSLALAAAGKMAAAVLFASIIFRFHSRWIGILSAVAFFISAILIWHEEPAAPAGVPANLGWSKAALACFASLFLTEWCDPGQISAAAMALRSHSLLPVWLGGTFALISKGGLAMTLGVKLRDRLPHRMLRPLACTSCCLLGVITLGKLFVK